MSTETLETQKEIKKPTDLLKYEAAFTEIVGTEPEVLELITALKDIQGKGRSAIGEIAQLPGYIGSGFDRDIFEHRQRAIKVLHPQSVLSFEEQLEPLVAGAGIPGLEQLEAASKEHGVIITDVLPGKTIAHIPAEELFDISDDHLLQLDYTLHQMRERGLHPHNISGVLYDTRAGFSFVDYGFEDGRDGFERYDRGKIPPSEEYLESLLADHVKIAEASYEAALSGGMMSVHPEYLTTGKRAEAQSEILRRWRELSSTADKTTNPKLRDREVDYNTNIVQGPIDPKYVKAYDTLLAQTPGLAKMIDRIQDYGGSRIMRLPNYIGHETSKDKHVVAFEGMAIKQLKAGHLTSFDNQIRPLIHGTGVPHLEQLLAINEREGLMFTSLERGVPIALMSAHDLLKIETHHLQQLDETLTRMRELNLHPHNLGGVLFDEETGFSFVDYEYQLNGNDYHNQGDMSSTETFLEYMLTVSDVTDKKPRFRWGKSRHEPVVTRAVARGIVLNRLEELRDKAA